MEKKPFQKKGVEIMVYNIHLAIQHIKRYLKLKDI